MYACVRRIGLVTYTRTHGLNISIPPSIPSPFLARFLLLFTSFLFLVDAATCVGDALGACCFVT